MPGVLISQQRKIYDVAVVGAGIAGLTAAALLRHDGAEVLLLEAHDKPGGCAGYFEVRDFSFSVGATVALGLEERGLHRRVFKYLHVHDYEAEPLDRLRVLLPDRDINIWCDAARWREERRRLPGHRAGQELFWNLQRLVADAGWSALERLPSLPLATSRDVARNLRLLDPRLLPMLPFLNATVGDVLRWCRVQHDREFTALLNLALIISVQTEAEQAPFTNGAAGIDLFQRGGYAMRGGIGEIARLLQRAFVRDGGVSLYGTPVCRVTPPSARKYSQKYFRVRAADTEYFARRVILNLPWRNVARLVDLTSRAARHVEQHDKRGGEMWGAVTLYAAVREAAVPPDAPLHQQVLGDYAARPGDGRDAFLSLSLPGDTAQAPPGWRTLNVSTHTRLSDWQDLDALQYRARKKAWRAKMLALVNRALPDFDDHRSFIVTGTPRTWSEYTGRDGVGGTPLTLQNSNLRALPQHCGIRNLWVVGDSTFPGQGTVACALSGLNVWRDITGGWL